MSRNARSDDVIIVLYVVFALVVLLFLAIRMPHAQESGTHLSGNLCSSNKLNEVGLGFVVVDIYHGERARALVQGFNPKQEHNWSATVVKVVADARDGFIFMYVIENDCVHTIIGRTAEEYRKVKK